MHSWSTLLDAGNLEGARAALRALFDAGSLPVREVAVAAEAAGDVTLALRAWQLVVRDTPDDSGAWAALASLHEARGDAPRALACRERAGLGGSNGAAERPAVRENPDADRTDATATDADLVRFCALFAGREGVHARMWRGAPESGAAVGYSPVEQSLTPDLLRLHIAGDHTLGVYLVRVDDTVTCCCFDLDVTRRAIQDAVGNAERTRGLRADLAAAGLALQQQLRALGLDPLFVDSGWKGRHLWWESFVLRKRNDPRRAENARDQAEDSRRTRSAMMGKRAWRLPACRSFGGRRSSKAALRPGRRSHAPASPPSATPASTPTRRPGGCNCWGRSRTTNGP